MSFIYDIKKQLIDIGMEFEHRYVKKAQNAGNTAPVTPDLGTPATPADRAPLNSIPDAMHMNTVALKLLDSLQNSLEDIFTKDMKNLRSFVNYCLDNLIERDGIRLVYRYQETGINALVGADFGKLDDALKAQYAPYPPGEESYQVHKAGMIRMIRELQQQAVTNKNKVAEVMLGKIIDEANRDLNLGMSKTIEENKSNNQSNQNQGGATNSGQGTGQSNQQGGNPTGANSGSSGTPVAKGEMSSDIKSALNGVYPLSNVLDLSVIQRFFQVVLQWCSDSKYQERFNQMLSSEIGAPVGSPIINERKLRITSIGRDGLNYTNQLMNLVGPSQIHMQDVTGSASKNNVETFQDSVLKPGKNMASEAVNVSQVFSYVINTIYKLLAELMQNNEVLTEQNQIAQAWIKAFAQLHTNAQQLARSEQAKLR